MINLPNWLNKFRKQAPSGGGGGGPGLIGSGVVAASTDGASVSAGPYDTTGASLIVIVDSRHTSASLPSDLKSNTWTLAKTQVATTGLVSIYYCFSPVTDPSHTFSTANVFNSFPSIAIFAFSGFAGPVDKTAGAFANSTQVNTGSVTPSTANQLLISAFHFNAGTTALIDSGFSTPLAAGSSGTGNGVGAAFLIQSVAAAINPQWTAGSSNSICAAIATFKQ